MVKSDKVNLVLAALQQTELTRPPVWLMRQAGRYLKEYNDLKTKHGFLELCHSPELALEVSLQPLRAFDVDAAIVFSDILIPLKALGIHIEFSPGPKIINPVKTPQDIAAITSKSLTKTIPFVYDTLSQLVSEVHYLSRDNTEKAVIGFAGAPWTLACYLIDQGPYKQFQGTQVFAYAKPVSIHELLRKLSELTTEHLLLQHAAGAQVVQLFDSWAGNLSRSDYQRFALPYTKAIIDALHKQNCPVILYINNSSHLWELMLSSGADCISIDWRTNLATTHGASHDKTTIQGNLDPTHLFGSREQVIASTETMLKAVTAHDRYIANLGHGVLPNTPRENVEAFVSTVKKGWLNV